MMLADLAIAGLIAGIGGYWYSAMRAREAGLVAVRAACEAEGLQLLDETIAFVRMRPQRNRTGQLCWLRVYAFEYSDTGDNRRPGSIHLLGDEVILFSLGQPTPQPRDVERSRWTDNH